MVSRVNEEYTKAINGKRILNSDKYYDDNLYSLNKLVEDLKIFLSKDERKLFSACIQCSKNGRFLAKKALQRVNILDTYDTESSDFNLGRNLFTELQNNGYISYEEDDDGYDSAIVDKTGFWEKIKIFCDNNETLLDEIIVNMNFKKFDE